MKKVNILLTFIISLLLISCSKKNTEIIIEQSISDDEVAIEMMNSYYATESNASGLLDSSNVGIIEDRFINENLYEIEENENTIVIDTSCFVYNNKEYFLIGSDGKNDIIQLQSAIEYAKTLDENKIKIIKLPEGDIDLIEGGNFINPKFGIVFKDAKNIAIVGDNTTIYIDGVMSSVLFENSENCYLENVNLDWARTPYSMGKVMDCDVEKRKVVVNVNSNYPIDEYVVIRQYLEYDSNGQIRTNANLMYDSKIESYSVDGQTVTIIFNEPISYVPKNTNIVLAHYSYDYRCIQAINSKNLYFENVNIWSAAGFAFEGYEDENLYFNRFNVQIRPNTDRLYVGTSDGIHTNECSGEIKITNCTFENTHDDSINICGIYMGISNVNKDEKTITISAISSDYPPRAGDEVEIYDKTTFEYIGKIKIETIERQKAETYKATYSGDDFDYTGNEVICDSTRSAKVLINNCLFRNKRNRAIIAQFRDSEISNCTFANICHGSIMVYTVTGNYNESLPTKNLVIKNNKFINNNSENGIPGDITTNAYTSSEYPSDLYVYENIEIKNNFFANTSRCGLYLNNLKDSNIENNLFYNMSLNYSSEKVPQYNCAISLENTENLTIKNNYNINSSNDDFVGIYVSATGTMEDKLHLVNNGGYLSTSVVKSDPAVTYVIGKIDKKIEIDGDLSDWDNVGTELAINAISDVQSNNVTDNDARKEHFNIKSLKAAYDDNGLYIAIDVFDDELIFLDETWYTVDYVELFMSTNIESKNPTSALKDMYTCMQYIALPDEYGGGRLDSSRTSQDVLKNVGSIKSKVIVNSSENGYTVEFFVPWNITDEFNNTYMLENNFSFTVVISDIGENRLRAQASTATHPVESNKYVPLRMSKFSFK